MLLIMSLTTMLSAMPKLPPRWTLAAALLAVGGCTSRTLPLPPPDVQEVSAPDDDGMVLVRGLATGGAAVGIFNDAEGRGVITVPLDTNCDSSCPFEASVPAQAGDALRVWQFFETPGTAHASVPEP